MIRPRKMKQIELTVLNRDVDRVVEYLGRYALMQFTTEKEAVERVGEDEENRQNRGPFEKDEKKSADQVEYERIKEIIQLLSTQAAFLGVPLPKEADPDSELPTEKEEETVKLIIERIAELSQTQAGLVQEKRKVEEALVEAKSFSNLKAPFSELDNLSYLTLRIGRLDPVKQADLNKNLGDRAIIVPLGEGDRVLAAASRKGRFALDSELKKASFTPLAVPEGFVGVPSELLSGLETRLAEVQKQLEEVEKQRSLYVQEYGPILKKLTASYLMAQAIGELKSRLVATKNAYRLTGWVIAAKVNSLVVELERITEGRIAIRSFDPNEIEQVRDGTEKVPVSLEHGTFVRGFERVVFSYGAPLYGSIDPTIFVAIFFTLLFGIMFGDVGQGFVLLLLGLLTKYAKKGFFARFKRFSIPLMAVGSASMVMGLLVGSVFSNEELLVEPTRFVTATLFGHPIDRFLKLMPERGSLDKLFMFFGFTLAVGVVINSVGLIINIINNYVQKNWEKAFFDKTGLTGAVFFWYALFMGLRILLGGKFAWFDLVGLLLPLTILFFSKPLGRLVMGERPLLENGLMVFFMEGFVEILESISSYISNTVSFLRVGAFALSHAVLSFIVFTLSAMVAKPAFVGPLFGITVMIIGNVIIILLEGMIVAIQVVRLQYYEFFSKFFTENGVEFNPFRFRREV